MTSPSFARRYGPWAAVTGASSGIGRAFAHDAARRGLGVLLAARRGDELERLAHELARAYGAKARVVAADLATAAGLDAVRAASDEADVGLFVAAAGFGTGGAFVDGALAIERELLAVNCGAVLDLTSHFARRFVARGRGGIVLMGSLLAWQGVPFSAHYAASKAYVQALAEALHVELAPAGVDVLASAPGPVASGFAARAGMRMGATSPPRAVARRSLDALGRRTTTVPGVISKALTYGLLPLPRPARVAVMGRIMHGMTHGAGAGAAVTP